jgi:hypothetical protein
VIGQRVKRTAVFRALTETTRLIECAAECRRSARLDSAHGLDQHRRMRIVLSRAALALAALVGFGSVSHANHIIGTSCGTSAQCAGHEYWGCR